MRTTFWSAMGLASVLLGGCASNDVGTADGDGADETFLTDDGKEDRIAGVRDGTADACAVLKLASTAARDTLQRDVGLTTRATTNILGVRAGDDGSEGTRDDGWFPALRDLDAVRWVGPVSFRRLLAYTKAHPDTACGNVDVQVLALNDFHGTLQPPSGSGGRIQTGPDPAVNRVDAGGAEFLATHLANLRARNPNTVFVAAGDLVGATPLLSALFHDEPTIESMNLMGLAITSVGNHEFDEGWAELLRMQGGGCHPVDGCQDGDGFDGAKFQYLAANVIVEETGETLLPQYEIRRFGGARVAFIGLPLEGTPEVTLRSGVAGLHFEDEAETVNGIVSRLKDRGIQTFVVLIHEGGAQVGLYDACQGMSGPIVDIVQHLDPAVDVVVSGHTHQAYNCLLGGRIVTSGANNGRLVQDIELTIDERTGDVAHMQAANRIVTRDVPRDAAQTALIARYGALAAPLANVVVGSVAGNLDRTANVAGETTMGEVIADAQLAATSDAAHGGAVAAFMNPGGVRADLVASQISGNEAAGEVTHGEAFTVQPFSNLLVTLTVSGAQLDTMLEQQWAAGPGGTEKVNLLQVSRGFTFTYDLARAIGDRVDPGTIRLNGAVVDPAASYRVTVNAFMADGGDGFAILRMGTDRITGAVDLDALEAYLRANPMLALPALDRVTRIAPPPPAPTP